jgi:hypothetical protein
LRRAWHPFARLQGIKAAYEAAFYKDAESIDEVIQSDIFERLSAVRNLIVHKSGIADDEYIQRTRGNRWVASFTEG